MTDLTRRSMLAATGGAAVLTAVRSGADDKWKICNGRIKQSVCAWCYKPMSVQELARAASALGCQSVELVGPEDWPVLKEHGLICAMTPSHPLIKGLNHVEHHAECKELIRRAIDANAEAGFPNVWDLSRLSAMRRNKR